jgi:two-component system, OmpR family, response regulator
MRPVRIFLVEDQPLIRQNLAETLESLAPASIAGWAEGQAEAEAWLAAHGSEVDLAVLDLSLREGRGLPLIGAARRAGLQVAVFSNHADLATRTRCLALGADAVFDKSREVDALAHWCARQAVAAPWRERRRRPRHWMRPFFKA